MKRILILTTATLLLAGIANAAPIQWDTGTNHNNHWYDVVWLGPSLYWADAKTFAEGKGGYLATITTGEENQFVWNFLTNNLADGAEYRSYWLGGYQNDFSGEPDEGWVWVTDEPWEYANWHPGEPNNGMEEMQHYLHFWDTDSGEWDDMDNGRHVGGYVVEYEQCPVPIPDASTMLLLGSSLIGFAGLSRRTKSRKRSLNP